MEQENNALKHYTAEGMAKQNVEALARDPDTAKLMEEVENSDIREDLGTNRINVIKRGDTKEELEEKQARRRYVIGIERALKQANIGPNSKCPCESGKKFKKCCRKLLDDTRVDIEHIAERLNLRREDEFLVSEVNAMLGKEGSAREREVAALTGF